MAGQGMAEVSFSPGLARDIGLAFVSRAALAFQMPLAPVYAGASPSSQAVTWVVGHLNWMQDTVRRMTHQVLDCRM
jgi:hypothetical protein